MDARVASCHECHGPRLVLDHARVAGTLPDDCGGEAFVKLGGLGWLWMLEIDSLLMLGGVNVREIGFPRVFLRKESMQEALAKSESIPV